MHFLLLALCCLVGLILPMSRIYDWEMIIFRKCGWNDFAAGREKQKPWRLPMSRTILGTLGMVCVLVSLIWTSWYEILDVVSGEVFHSTFDQRSLYLGIGVGAIKVRFLIFTFFTVVSLPYIAIVRWKSNRSSPSGYWLFTVTTTAICVCLLAPLTSAIGRLVAYIQAMGFTRMRIYGLLYGLGGYIIVLGFLYWANRTPGKKNAQPTAAADALQSAAQL